MSTHEHDSVRDKVADLAEEVKDKAADIAEEAKKEALEAVHDMSAKAKAEYAATMKSPKKQVMWKMIALFILGVIVGALLF
jgi:F0F1-type ATP synthase membrane subunit b/b'